MRAPAHGASHMARDPKPGTPALLVQGRPAAREQIPSWKILAFSALIRQ